MTIRILTVTILMLIILIFDCIILILRWARRQYIPTSFLRILIFHILIFFRICMLVFNFFRLLIWIAILFLSIFTDILNLINKALLWRLLHPFAWSRSRFGSISHQWFLLRGPWPRFSIVLAVIAFSIKLLLPWFGGILALLTLLASWS